VELEFLHYDVTRSGTVPGIDFARSLVASSDVKRVDALLDKVRCVERGWVPLEGNVSYT